MKNYSPLLFLDYKQVRVQVRGFTLIEMMIVVAVIGILSAIAFPSYASHIQKSRRVDAKNAVLDLAGREERYFSINNAYTNDAAALGYSALPLAVNSSGSSFYSLNVTITTTPPGFVATATPTGAQTNDATCYAFRANQLGMQSNLDSGGTSLTGTGCW